MATFVRAEGAGGSISTATMSSRSAAMCSWGGNGCTMDPTFSGPPRNGGHWIFTRADDIYEAYRNDAVFSSEFVAVPKEEARMMKFAPAEYDKPDHSKYRLVIAPLFTPLAVEAAGGAGRRAFTHADRARARRGPLRFHSGVRRPATDRDFPVDDGFADRGDHALLAPHVEAMTRNPDPAAISTAFQTMIGYLAEKVDARQGKGGDDAISRMLAARVGDRPVTREEVLSLAANVTVWPKAGIRSSRAWDSYKRFLAMNPDHRRRLVDAPEDIS